MVDERKVVTTQDTLTALRNNSSDIATPAVRAKRSDAKSIRHEDYDFVGGDFMPTHPAGLGPGFDTLGVGSSDAWLYRAVSQVGDLPGTLQRRWIRGMQQVVQVAAFVKEFQLQGMESLVTFVGDYESFTTWDNLSSTYAPVLSGAAYGAQIVRALERFEVLPTYVELWNEPDYDTDGTTPGAHWNPGRLAEQDFAEFHAKAAAVVYPFCQRNGIKFCTPGIASLGLGGVKFVDRLIEAGARFDVVSVHGYNAEPYWYQSYGGVVQRFKERCSLRRVMVTEWNTTLNLDPMYDGHVRAAGYCASLLGMHYAGIDRHCFFYMKDAGWETFDDWAGGLGMFTLSGYPKTVVAGMQFMRALTKLSETTMYVRRCNNKHNDVMVAMFEMGPHIVVAAARWMHESEKNLISHVAGQLPDIDPNNLTQEQKELAQEVRADYAVARMTWDNDDVKEVSIGIPYELDGEIVEGLYLGEETDVADNAAYRQTCRAAQGSDLHNLVLLPAVAMQPLPPTHRRYVKPRLDLKRVGELVLSMPRNSACIVVLK